MSADAAALAALAADEALAPLDGLRVLIVGGTGFIGGALVEALAARGRAELHLLSRRAQARPGVRHVSASVLDAELASRLPAVDAAVYVAGPTSNYLDDPLGTIRVATEGLAAVLAALPPAARAVLVSSTRIYGARRDTTPLTEETPSVITSPDLRNVYDGAKLAGEALALQAATKGRRVAIARVTNVYGRVGAASPPTVFTQLVGQAAKDGVVRVTGAPSAVRNHLHVVDAAQGILRALARGEGGRVYNIASDDHETAEGLARRIAAASPRPVRVELNPNAPAADHMVVSAERARRELGYAARCSLERMLPDAVGAAFREAA